MSRISLNRVSSLPDIQTGTHFEFLLGKIPGSSDTDDLTVKCQNVMLPGSSNEAFEVNLHGHTNKQRGRKRTPNLLSVTYLEDSKGRTYQKLRHWSEMIVGTNSGNGLNKAGYSVKTKLFWYSDTGAIVSEYDFIGMFIQELSDAQLDGASSQPVQVPVSFSYDYYTMVGVPIL